MSRSDDLIFDIGVHAGEDSRFYLSKGFRVVGVEANPDLCESLRHTFRDAIAAGRFILIEAAIAETEGNGTFYRFAKSEWGTTSAEWAERNKGMGLEYHMYEVRLVTPETLYAEYGIPYYMKIDIEGADMLCVDGLRDFATKPRFISVESEKHDFSKFERELRRIADLGYKDFQIVQQQLVPFQRVPNPPREGRVIHHRFSLGSSGLFGRDLPEDHWKDADSILRKYRRIVRKHQAFGDYALGRSRLSRNLLRAVGLYPGWHDLHARLDDSGPL